MNATLTDLAERVAEAKRRVRGYETRIEEARYRASPVIEAGYERALEVLEREEALQIDAEYAAKRERQAV